MDTSVILRLPDLGGSARSPVIQGRTGGHSTSDAGDKSTATGDWPPSPSGTLPALPLYMPSSHRRGDQVTFDVPITSFKPLEALTWMSLWIGIVGK